MRLYGRAARIVAGSLLLEGFRVTFRVKKTSGKEPNTCEVQLFNLAEQSRAGLQQKGTRLIVEAGYGKDTAQIFAGDSRLVEHVHEGPDWITKIQCGDGERAYRYARTVGSYAAGTARADVFARIAQATGLDVREAVAVARAQLKDQFIAGHSVSGRVADELDRVLDGTGLEWSVHDGKMQLLRYGEVAKDQAVLLTPDTGLLGSPVYGSPAAKGKPQTLKVQSLLQPGIRPGGRVRVASTGITGDFRVLEVTHSGDTEGADWFSECEMVPA